MLDNMVVPLSTGEVDVSMLKEAVKLINGRFETEVENFNFVHFFGILYLYVLSHC